MSYQVVTLDEHGSVDSCFGVFPTYDEFVARILTHAKERHGDRAVLQFRPDPMPPQWQTITNPDALLGPICGGEFARPDACTCGDPESHDA